MIKRLSLFITITIVLASVLSTSVFSLKTGDKLGDVLNTDIKAYIDNNRIPCYSIDGNIVVSTGDLINYWFETSWDGNSRSTKIILNKAKKISPIEVANSTKKSGTVAFSYVYTDIKVYVNDKKVDSYSANGQMYIKMNELSVYGKYVWDSKTKTVNLTINPVKSYKEMFGKSVATNGAEKPGIEYTKQDRLCVYFTYGDGTWSGISSFLPAKYESATPYDVGAILIYDDAKRTQTKVGEYTNGAKAYRESCIVKLFDPYTGVEIASAYFEGKGSPPSVVTSANDVYLYPDDEAIGRWIDTVWGDYLILKSPGVLASASDFDYTVSNNSVTITKYKGNKTSIIIPDKIDGKTVTVIGERAFQNCFHLKSVTIPKTVTSIEKYAFDGCFYLLRANIPENITSISWGAFSGCVNLLSIEIPKGVTEIDAYAFSRCSSLTEIIIPNGVISIGYNAFAWCTKLKSVTIPASVTFIREKAFEKCDDLTVICPKDSYAYDYCVENKLKYQIK